MLDDGHVGRPVPGVQARQVVVEHHVEHPAQPVLNPLMAADHAGEGLGIELGRAEAIAPLLLDLAVPLGPAFDHAEHGKSWEGGFAGVTAVREQPAHVVADGVRAGFDPAVLTGSEEAMGRLAGIGIIVGSCNGWMFPMTQVDDLSRSLAVFDQNTSLIVVVELERFQADWTLRTPAALWTGRLSMIKRRRAPGWEQPAARWWRRTTRR